MKVEYQDWINSHYPTFELAQLKCVEATKKMIKEFPELKLAKGAVRIEEPHGLPPTLTPHCWCLDENCDIIDPTVKQYFTKILEYTKYDDDNLPTGKCPNCGEYCFNHTDLCSDKCEKEYEEYING